jgi:translocation and assembly module TamB
LRTPDDPPASEESPAVEALKGPGLPKAIVAVSLALVVLFATLIAATRYGVLLPQARLLIEARANGLAIGRLGRLNIEGLSGDIWREFRIRKLTVRDEKGVWLEADDVHLHWRYVDLLVRRFHADRFDAATLRLIRRPTLGPKGKAGGLPVSFYIDEAHTRVVLLPGFSQQSGAYDFALNLAVTRNGATRGTIQAASVASPGDHANVQFDFDKHRPLVLLADAVEAHGGALAGALGLPTDKPFLLRVAAGGKASAGRFSALVVSGADRPLDAVGAWTPDGGQARGHLRLAASTLTAPFAAKVGPEVTFALTGRKTTGDLYGLALQADAANLSLRAQGLGDLGQRRLGPKGVTLAATTTALSKITGGPQMGAARVAGVLSGQDAKWRFAGSAAVSRVALGGYSADAVSGPVELTARDGEWAAKARLAAAGGRGAGWIAAMLGGAPRASLEGARLRDGRLSLRSLEVVGAGLKADASGGRGLLGGLTFKGRADISNLAAAHGGANGAAHIDWSAGQGRPQEPWALKVDATAERFATGYPELDRLLGAKPKLSAQGALQGRRFALAGANLDGAALNANAAGLMAEDGKLSFKLAWNAQGPFHAGPVEISGKASGDGAITGTLGAPRADLMAQLAVVDFPGLQLRNGKLTLTFQQQADGASGKIAATAESAYGPARGRADFRFPEGGLDLTGLSMDAGGLKTDGSLSLHRNSPSGADLTVAAGPGAFLEAGRVSGRLRIVDAPGGSRAQIALTAEGARQPGSSVTVTGAKLTADGPLTRLPYALSAQGVSSAGRFAADGKGVFSTVQPGYQATFDGSGRLGARDMRTVQTAVFRFGGPERSARLRLVSSDGGHISVDGRLTDQTADVRAQLAGVGLNLLDEDLAGKMDADLSLTGHGGRLDGDLQARLSGARGRGAASASAVDSTLRGRLAGTSLSIDANATNGQGLRANASLVLPVVTAAAPFRIAIARQEPMQGRFFADGEVRPLWDLLIGGERSLSGRVQTQGTLGGTLANPRASGQVAVQGGRFDDGATGLTLRNVAIQANFAQEAVEVTQAGGDDGHGGSV